MYNVWNVFLELHLYSINTDPAFCTMALCSMLHIKHSSYWQAEVSGTACWALREAGQRPAAPHSWDWHSQPFVPVKPQHAVFQYFTNRLLQSLLPCCIALGCHRCNSTETRRFSLPHSPGACSRLVGIQRWHLCSSPWGQAAQPAGLGPC